jgi:hypothetical protein
MVEIAAAAKQAVGCLKLLGKGERKVIKADCDDCTNRKKLRYSTMTLQIHKVFRPPRWCSVPKP